MRLRSTQANRSGVDECDRDVSTTIDEAYHSEGIQMGDCPAKRFLLRLVVLVFCTAPFGQSADLSRQNTFHVSGSITQSGRTVPGAWVIFEGTSTKSVKADGKYYEADLPVGIWTATVTILGGGAEAFKKSRPRLFRLTAPTKLVLDLFVRPAVGCGGVHLITPDNRPATREELDEANESCHGQEFFPVPSDDGVPFELVIGGRNHNLCSRLEGANKAACNRAFATYNALTVQADNIVYNPREWLLEASGNVLVEDGNLEYRRDSIRFFIGDGQAVPVY